MNQLLDLSGVFPSSCGVSAAYPPPLKWRCLSVSPILPKTLLSSKFNLYPELSMFSSRINF